MEKKKKKQAKGKKKKKVLSEREQFEKDNPKNGPTDTVLKIQEQIENHTKNWKEAGTHEELANQDKIRDLVLPEVE